MLKRATVVVFFYSHSVRLEFAWMFGASHYYLPSAEPDLIEKYGSREFADLPVASLFEDWWLPYFRVVEPVVVEPVEFLPA